MIRVACPGSCGELFQGVVDGQELLLTYGIDLYSRVSLSVGRKSNQALGAKQQAVLNDFPQKEDLSWTCESQLPIGKGCSVVQQICWLVSRLCPSILDNFCRNRR